MINKIILSMLGMAGLVSLQIFTNIKILERDSVLVITNSIVFCLIYWIYTYLIVKKFLKL
jgi:hypothetical protein